MFTAIVLSGCALVAALYMILNTKRSLSKLPGPRGLPIIGNILQLDMGKPHVCLAAWAKRYGGVMLIRLIRTPVVVVSSPKHIHAVLVGQGAEFANRPRTYRNDVLNDQQSGVAFTDRSPEHSGRRKLMQSYLRQYGSGMTRIEEITITAITDMMHKLQEFDGQPADVRPLIFNCFTDIIGILLIGETMEPKDARLAIDSMYTGMKLVTSGGSGVILDIFPWLRFFGNTCYNKLISIINVRTKLVTKWMESRPNDGFIHYMQGLTSAELTRHSMDKPVNQMNVSWEIIVAGVFTSSSSIVTLVNILSQRPQIQQRLQNEVSTVVGDSRPPSLQDRANMPYHQACLLELGRFASLVPLGIPHFTKKEVQLDGYTVPPKTQIWCNLWAMHHDESIWDEPFEFCPERFLGESGKLVTPDHKNRHNLMPFGAGPRVCVGEMMAMGRMFLVLASLMQQFNILPESSIEAQPSIDSRDTTLGLVLTPPAYKVRLTQRA